MLKLKTLWRDGTTYLVMSPLDFMQRLAALVVPQRPESPAQTTQPGECEANCAQQRTQSPDLIERDHRVLRFSPTAVGDGLPAAAQDHR